MANEEKIRILDEQPAENAGSLLYIRTLAGSSDASKPTSQLANGSVFIETDTGKVFIFDEDNGWTEMQAGGGGGGGGSLPAVTSSDNGKVLGVVDGEWAASEQGKKFIVTLTPTSPDFSGTMDKTVAEINAAYEAGQQIVFRVILASNEYIDVNVTAVMTNADYDYPSFNAYVIEISNGLLVYAYTPETHDGTLQTYGTRVYSLTPAS